MKKWLRIICVLLPLLVPVQVVALSVDREYSRDEVEPSESIYPGNPKANVKAADTMGQTSELSEALPAPSGDAGKNTLEEKVKMPGEGKSRGAQPVEEKGQIALQAEPGDSVAVLRWKVRFRQKPGDQPLRFMIMYGPESGKYDKTIDVGSSSLQEKLHDLRNHQVYYIKIQAYTTNDDRKISFTSNEVRVVPLPEKELSSLLEQSFSGTPVTLQDRKDRGEMEPFKRELRQFGYDFFRNSRPAEVPLEDVPVGNDYIIGPGDSIRIDMWGSVNSHREVDVDRNGEIAIPKVGVVKVWGLNYAQAKESINKAISRYFTGYEINVTLGRLRTIQVFVVGEVEAPGTYHITAMGTVINALSMGGGPTKNGSLRGVKLLKGGKVVQEIDLYDMFLSGDRSRDIRIENGDTIFVPVVGPVVAVAGEVKRPAIYELKGKTRLSELMTMAGGITAAGYTARIQVERYEGNSAKVIIDHETKPESLDGALTAVEMHDRDMVKVFPVNKAMRRMVSLKGNVPRSGEYQFREGMRLTDILPGYEALLPNSWLDSVEITRLALPDYHREILTVNLKKALAGDKNENVLLQEQDSIRIFAQGEKEEKRTVAVSGQVVSPGTFDYYPNMRVRDLVTLAGSPKWNALLDNAELTRIVVEQGRAKSTRLSVNLRGAIAGLPDDNMLLQPNDVLIVRGIVDWLEAKERFVTLKGEVRYPGIYSIAKGERLSSVIERAGGFSDNAYLRGAKFTRLSVQETQQKRMDEVIAKSEQDILKRQAELSSVAASKEELEATKASLDGLMKGLDKLKAVKALGRVVIHLSSLEKFKRSPYDIELSGGDTLEIPLTPNVVTIMGQVYNSTTLIHMPQKSLSYYLQKSGGPTRDAEASEMYLIKADGTVVSREQSSLGIRWDEDGNRWTFGGFMSAPVDPGDTLVVPQKLDRIAWMREIKDITTILSQIALTAGVVVAAGL